MLVGQELEERGEEVMLLNHINTDAEEQENWQQLQQGKGFIRDARGNVTGRHVANIPVEEAAMLLALKDADYTEFSQTGDKQALRRLLLRFPHWRCAEGRV